MSPQQDLEQKTRSSIHLNLKFKFQEYFEIIEILYK